MKKSNFLLYVIVLGIGFIFTQCIQDENFEQPPEMALKSGETVDAGNCLSFPVVWAEGVTKNLRGTAGVEPVTNGEWWYWWGTNDDGTPMSGQPDPDDTDFIDNSISDSVDVTKIPGEGWLKVFLQKDEYNVWQAEATDGSLAPVVVNAIDWGDNLESVPWYLNSKVRTEVVLYKNNLSPTMLQYEMRHVSGWGIDEVHGLAVAHQENSENALTIESTEATVYSACARLTIQKLDIPRTEIEEGMLVWQPGEGWTENDTISEDLIEEPVFNLSVADGGDGPGYYSAEINVKGKVIYGYTWNVRKLNDGAGDYRLTFSFDSTGTNCVDLNTFFEEGTTEILVPLEEEEVIVAAEETEHGGGVAKIDFANNLTYIDVHIDDAKGGNKK
ncbi:hypothetical protein INQ51_00165 [Maribellus sp. CM-23]|uniref:hypothetical protein n=1 Tax=Maribellus sp. CM-23 TaxID=2781026 RepID=UPI001F3012E5|nr:hypothetical protein [Maribellus sp. CM-23]MCE4562706.1 hypothetical protein [Maribellus sp. CM-23]